jgi:hypothetical protein
MFLNARSEIVFRSASIERRSPNGGMWNGALASRSSWADMSRFSRREGHEVVGELRQIGRKAKVWFYESGAPLVLGDIGSNIATYAVAEANADYRRKIRTKTIAAMKHKAALGHGEQQSGRNGMA